MSIRSSSLALFTACLALACASRGVPRSAPASLGLDWHIAPATLAARCEAVIAATRAAVAKALLIPAGQRTFSASLRPIEEATETAQNEFLWLGQLYLISPDSATRDASRVCSEKATDYGVEIASDARIYAAAQEAHRDPAVTAQEDRQLIKLYLEIGRRNGAGLDTANRVRVTDLFKRLNDLQRDYGVRLAEDSSSIAITQAEARSLSPQLLASSKKTNSGYIVLANESTAGDFLSHESNAAARERFYVAYIRRGGKGNDERLEKALALRDTLAHLLGFNTWAAYQLDTKMAKSPEAVMKFLEDIDAALLPKAKAEYAVLGALKKPEEGNDKIRAWDRSYYGERLRVTKYSLDEQVVRRYFPLDHVVPAVLEIYQTLLSVRFDERPNPDVWASGVREFRVSDSRSGKMMGVFYLDLYPRANKYDHFAAFPFHARLRKVDGSETMPVCGIIGNWPTPAPGAPSLLSHGDVLAFFHEFGHVMHCMLSQTRYATTGPFNGRQDFGEAPSQMLENWVWQPEVLKRISKSVDTGRSLPDSIIARIIQLRHFDDGRNWTRAAFFSIYDMKLHMSKLPIDPFETWARLSESTSLVETIPGTYPSASFGHLMSGYDAGYYGYLWSKVYAEDMFSRFENEGLFNSETGLAYREQILQPGGTEEPSVFFERFMGRPLSYDAFYRSIGVEKTASAATQH
jgi:thimet oligopeptidase